MLSDEEKEAIERLTKKMEYYKNKPLDTHVWLTLDEHYVRTILNLIEKQSKEIEELKEKNNKLMEELDLTTVYISGVYDGEKKVEGKIKAKIEEEKECGSVDGTNEMIIEVLQSLLEKE